MQDLLMLPLDTDAVDLPDSDQPLAERAETFCTTVPHRRPPYAKRNWGGTLHSLCSYQGKLKPAIAHFLVREFTQPGSRVLDPMCGVGTVPLEARRQGRVGVAADLSPLAVTVTKAKLVPVEAAEVLQLVESLEQWIARGPDTARLIDRNEAEFGLNGPISSYFHQDTLREVLLAREFFLRQGAVQSDAAAVVMSSVLHILHGNRPYALSRRSHPVTPFAPTGPTEYRPLLKLLRTRLDRVLPELGALAEASSPGEIFQTDFRTLDTQPVDAVITSPPFSRSVRFWSSNWMRLWFCGWSPDDFQNEPRRYLETQQRGSLQPYEDFAESMYRLLPAGGLLIMHLGETVHQNMAEGIVPWLESRFQIAHVGRECVADTESHGLVDKGATVAHWYLFAHRRP